MLRYVLRRLLWVIPTLFVVSLVAFALATLLPAEALTGAPTDVQQLVSSPAQFDLRLEAYREAFLDLPLLFNVAPEDVRTRVETAVHQLELNGPDAPLGAHTLVTTGGAGLPYLLPRLDDLSPEARGRVALALAPLAERMGETRAEGDADSAARFWAHFWDDRSLDFTRPSAERQVSRMATRETDLREQELRRLDTYALPELVDGIRRLTEVDELARLTTLARHATGAGPVLNETSSAADVRRAKAWWRAFWHVHRADYVPLDGFDRLIGSVGETRYGRWIFGAAGGDLGLSARDGEPIADKLRERAPVTLVLTFSAMVLAFAVAIPLAVIGAWMRGKRVDRVVALVLFALHAVPTFWGAEILIRLFGFARVTGAADLTVALDTNADTVRRLWLPVVALAITVLAVLSRQQRAALLDVLGQDFVRTARAKGLSEGRTLVVHALRAALLPTVTLAGMQLPALLGGALVVEEVFALPGLGWETLRAVEVHDARWLVAVVLLVATLSTLGLLASDVAYGLLDPRVRDAQRRIGEGRA